MKASLLVLILVMGCGGSSVSADSSSSASSGGGAGSLPGEACADDVGCKDGQCSEVEVFKGSHHHFEKYCGGCLGSNEAVCSLVVGNMLNTCSDNCCNGSVSVQEFSNNVFNFTCK